MSEEYVSECCGAEIGYYSNAFMPLPSGETEGWICSKCHKPCEVIEEKEEEHD